LQRLLQQSVIRAPFNIRPFLGIPPLECTKARGYMALGYILTHRRTKDATCRDRALLCLDWLRQNPSPGSRQYGWGNHYHFTTRSGKIPRFVPTIVWTSLIGQAFVEAYETWSDPAHLEIATSVCNWILDLPREKTDSGTCLSYISLNQSSIHNSNMLGAALLARVGTLINRNELVDVAREAIEYSCSRQNPDGSWFYGEAPKYHWIDNFHTGYNLDSLKGYIEATGDDSFKPHLRNGYRFFVQNFLESSGCPRYYHNKTYPIDIQCAAQAIDTLALFSDDDPKALALAEKVATWTIDHMQDKDGYFYYRNFGWAFNRTPLLHWGQATMFKALAHLLLKSQSVPSAQTGSQGLQPAELP